MDQNSVTNSRFDENKSPVTQDIVPQPSDIAVVIEKLRDLVASQYLNVNPDNVQIRASALFSRLKALNRISNGATRVCKQETSDARQGMDQTHLRLQNLLYEKRHLEREIEKCRQFASIYQDVPLQPLDDFQILAPEEARTEDVMQNEHQLMLNRLSFELAERQRLDLRKKELAQQKEILLKQSKTKRVLLDGVKTNIDTLFKTAVDMQKKVDEAVQSLPSIPSTASTVTE